MSKCIINRNSKGEYHGYQEWYHANGELWVKGFCDNAKLIDYREVYYFSDGLRYKYFNI